MALIDKLKAIADGFRASRGTEQEYSLDEMAVLAAEKGEAVPDGSEVTFGNVDGNPVEREEAYAVASSALNRIAAHAQRMAGTHNLLTVAEIDYWLGRVIYVPQGNAETDVNFAGLFKTDFTSP